MSYFGRNLKNKFPLWSRIRSDDSSFGAAVLDGIGTILEEERIGIFQAQESFRCLEGKPVIEPSEIYLFNLNNNENYLNLVNENKELETIFCTGQIGDLEIPIEVVESYEEFCRKDADRFSWELLESNVNLKLKSFSVTEKFDYTEYDFKEKYTKIFFEVKENELFYSESTHPLFTGKSIIKICGVGEDNKNLEEEIFIKDSGVYESKNFYKKLKPLHRENEIKGGASIEIYGFDAEVNVFKTHSLDVKYLEHPYQTFTKVTDDLNVTNSLIENNSRFKLINENNKSFIEFEMVTAGEGKDYKLETQRADISLFRNVLSKKVILDGNLETTEVDNFTLDLVRNNLVTIDKNLIINFYNIDKTRFLPKGIFRTKKVDFAIEAESQYVTLEEPGTSSIHNLYISFDRPKSQIEKFFIGRHTPERRELYGEDTFGFDFEFLQNDYSWEDTFNSFTSKAKEGVDALTIPVEYKEVGQYDYYIFHITGNINNKDVISLLENGDIDEDEFKKNLISYSKEPLQENLFINNYSVICDFLEPELVLSLEEIFAIQEEQGILEKIEELEGSSISVVNVNIFFKGLKNEMFLHIETAVSKYLFKVIEKKDFLLFSYESGQGAFLQEYDSVELVINDNFVEVIEYD